MNIAATRGYTVSNTVGFALILATKLLLGNSASIGTNGTLIFSEFVIIPIIMGIINAWFWRGEVLGTRKIIGRACISGLIAIALSYLCLGEGTICLIIVSPLLFTFIALVF